MEIYRPTDVVNDLEPGFYWIKLITDEGGDEFEPAEWTGEYWFMLGSDSEHPFYQADVIGDRIKHQPRQPLGAQYRVVDAEIAPAPTAY